MVFIEYSSMAAVVQGYLILGFYLWVLEYQYRSGIDSRMTCS